MRNDNILVIGGSGFYGSYLVNDLIRFTKANIIVASRNPPSAVWADPSHVRYVRCDMTDLKLLEELAKESRVIVHCAGPFQKLPLNPLRAAIHTKADTIDISEDRRYMREVRSLESSIRDAGISVLNGISVAPAMEVLFTKLMQKYFDDLLSVRTFAAPDTRKHRGPAMFHTMLLGVGRSFRQPEGNTLKQVWGWTEPEWVEFPAPLRKRLTYLVLEMADLDLLPELFGVKSVQFKAGTEWPVLNRLLGLAAIIRKSLGHPHWESFSPIVRALSWLMGRFGRDEGGVIFEFRGIRNEILLTHKVALIARKDGGLIPAVLAAIAAEKLINGDLAIKGIVPLHEWISSEELIKKLQQRSLELWWKLNHFDKWQLLDVSAYQSYVGQ